MTHDHVIKAGEYLGADDRFGYIYSVFTGYTRIGLKRFSIVSIRGGQVTQLLSFTGV